ncbi:hypothetical protein J437_LFUL002763 [Ladona fulva]|uniref:Uncharacterized protein n=1 Tax=Ladona fulva TaxID=123851 RepID=A0A8K0JU52_LADFU|nr:hypothetical protein J437_LFUL002763 [Ladona fulva]
MLSVENARKDSGRQRAAYVAVCLSERVCLVAFWSTQRACVCAKAKKHEGVRRSSPEKGSVLLRRCDVVVFMESLFLAYGNLGNVLSSQGRMAEAEWAYKMALKYRSNMADVHYNL